MAAVFGKGHGCRVIKSAQDSTAFTARKDVSKFFGELRNSKVLMGHTRFATQGSIKDVNAHPFIHDHIVLAHNGGISNKEELSKNTKSFEVDSEAICHSIAKEGAEATLKKLQGNFALTFYDYDKKTFNIIRNDGRPMFYAKAKYRQAWFYASEPWMIKGITERNRTEIDVIESIPVGVLLTYDVVNGRLNTAKMALKDPTQPTHGTSTTRGGGGFLERRNMDIVDAYELTAEEEETGNYRKPAGPTTSVSMYEIKKQKGLRYLDSWGLAVNDFIEILGYEPVRINGNTGYMKMEAWWGGPSQNSPDARIMVFGFSDKNWEAVQNTDGKYYTKIGGCTWAGDKYEVQTYGLFRTPPHNGLVVPFHRSNVTKLTAKNPETPKTETVVPQIVSLEEASRGSLPSGSTGDTKEADKESSKVITVDDLDDQHMLELAESMRKQIINDNTGLNSGLVEGPNRRLISFMEWSQMCKYGCANCSTDLTLRDYKFDGDNVFCVTCYLEREFKKMESTVVFNHNIIH